jgi:hypothetical protein
MQTPEQRPRATSTKVMHCASNAEKSGQYRRGAPLSESQVPRAKSQVRHNLTGQIVHLAFGFWILALNILRWATSLKVKRPALTRTNTEHYRGGSPI